MTLRDASLNSSSIEKPNGAPVSVPPQGCRRKRKGLVESKEDACFAFPSPIPSSSADVLPDVVTDLSTLVIDGGAYAVRGAVGNTGISVQTNLYGTCPIAEKAVPCAAR